MRRDAVAGAREDAGQDVAQLHTHLGGDGEERVGARALAVAATVAAAAVVWLVGEPLLGNDLVIPLLLRTPRTGDAP